jgi:hypothetical protein
VTIRSVRGANNPASGSTDSVIAPETILIPSALLDRAVRLGLRTVYYRRAWLAETPQVVLPTNAATVTVRIATDASGPFAITRLELYFEGGLSTITVPRGREALKATADIRYSGTGTIRARWRVAEPGNRTIPAEQLAARVLQTPPGRYPMDDWRILADLRRTVTFGDRILLPSPDAPSLPTFLTGPHLVTLEILQGQPGDPFFNFQYPIARYFVTSSGPTAAGGSILALRLAAPDDGARLPLAPPSFAWSPIPGVAQYRLEIYEVNPTATSMGAVTRLGQTGQRIVGAVTQGGATTYSLHPAYLGRFRPGSFYLWKVVALSGSGDPVSASALRTFSFAPQ